MNELYEEFAKHEGRKHKDLIVARYNGVNESEVFKTPEKLPAILLFKNNGDGVREVVDYKHTYDAMVKGKDSEELT